MDLVDAAGVHRLLSIGRPRMQSMTNRRSPRVPNAPWRGGPGNLTIAQTVALLLAGLAAGGVWWLAGFTVHGGLLATFGHILVTSIAGGGLALLFYSMADPTREPTIRQHLFFTLRRHTYISKEPRHDSEPIPFHTPQRAPGPRHAAARVGQRRAPRLALPFLGRERARRRRRP